MGEKKKQTYYIVLQVFSWQSVVKTLPSNARVKVRCLVGQLRSHIPCGQKDKT